MSSLTHDVIILGAGGAGLMCAAEAGKRGRRVLVLDHGEVVGRKILISGGGRCNFTNIGARAACYISGNPHFCKSALAGYTPADFITLVQKHGIAYHEKKLGQLFCDGSAQQIVDMLMAECVAAGTKVQMQTEIEAVQHENGHYTVRTNKGIYSCERLVVATGGLSIPQIGATPLGYKLAEQFGVPIVPPRAALVPFTYTEKDLALYGALAGMSFEAILSCNKAEFREQVLITHRGFSGPAILQISSYWKPGDVVMMQIEPDLNWQELLKTARKASPKQALKTVLGEHLPKRFAVCLAENGLIPEKEMANLSDKEIQAVHQLLTQFPLKPNGTEGYRKAEVTAGGVDTNALHAASMECRAQKGLYFIGEVVDVTGWLGGYNFQWAWASGVAAGRAV